MSPLVCGVNHLLKENEESTAVDKGRGVEHHFSLISPWIEEEEEPYLRNMFDAPGACHCTVPSF